MLVRHRLVLFCALAALALIAAPAAHGQGGTGPLISPPAPEVNTAPPGDEESDDGLGSTAQLLMLVAALALIGGITWVIFRDARRNAPARAAPLRSDEEAGGPEQRRRSTRDRDKRRAKSKQARQQRKRNR